MRKNPIDHVLAPFRAKRGYSGFEVPVVEKPAPKPKRKRRKRTRKVKP